MGKGGWNASWNADYLHIANGRIEEITWEIEGRILDLKHQTRMLRTNLQDKDNRKAGQRNGCLAGIFWFPLG